MWLLRVHCRICLFTSLPHCAVRGKRRSTRVPALLWRRQHSGCQRSDSAGRFPSSRRRNCHASHFLGYVADSRPCHRAQEVMQLHYLAFHFAAETKRMYQGNKTFARCLRNAVSRTRVLRICLKERQLKCEESVAKVTASDGDT